jgi:DNA-binding response OmpR family regulator
MRALAADIPLSVLIVDWQLPVMDGIEFTGKFRAGVDHYLTKGVREPEQVARIHAGLHAFSLRVQLREARAALALAGKRRDGT